MKKKGTFEISISGIIFLIIMIVLLILGIFFIRGTFGEANLKFEEQVSREPEPAIPIASYPITLSRETIITNSGKTEAVKISVFNPTNQDWTFRDALDEPQCGNSDDGICFINPADDTNICNNDENAGNNDEDCGIMPTCDDTDNDGPGPGCLIDIRCKEGKQSCVLEDKICPPGYDPDCAPTEGVRLNIECSQELDLSTQTNPKTIPVGELTTFTALLKIKKGIPKRIYLCKISIVGEGTEGITKDLQVKVS